MEDSKTYELTAEQMKQAKAYASVLETAPKIKACSGKSHGDICIWETSSGQQVTGKCIPIFLSSGLYCSDLNF